MSTGQKGRLSNSSEPPYLTLDKDRREKVVKVASLSTHLVGGPTYLGFHERRRVLECPSGALAHTPG